MSRHHTRLLCALTAACAGIWLVAPAGAAKSTGRALPVRLHRSARRRHSSRARARAAIVNGTQISVSQTPWQVAVHASYKSSSGEEEGILCGGVIIDVSHILTAAHCVFIASPNERIPPEDFTVQAGTSDMKEHTTEEQLVGVSSVRVHPYYTYTPESGHVNPDDVAVLTLSEPLKASAAVSPIALTALGGSQPAGTAVQVSGFGEENPLTGEVNGKLYSLPEILEANTDCGGENNAVLLCARSSSGSFCSGDSGGAMTLPGATQTLIGVIDAGEVLAGHRCATDSQQLLANVAAPEIYDFIEGSEAPPKAPRGSGATCQLVAPVAGQALTCTPGSWSGEPTFTYDFIAASSGQVLQSGPYAQFTPSSALVGQSIIFEAIATNAGGSASDRAQPTAAVEPAPAQPKPKSKPSSLRLANKDLTVNAGNVTVKLTCQGAATCKGKLTFTVTTAKGKKRTRRTITIATSSFSVASGKTQTITVKIDSTGRRLLRSAHGKLKATATFASTQKRTETVLLAERKPHR